MGHNLREKQQSLAGDAERDHASMSPGHSTSSSQMQVLEPESCDIEFLSKGISLQTTVPIRDGKDKDEQLLHKLGLYFYLHGWQLFKNEM